MARHRINVTRAHLVLTGLLICCVTGLSANTPGTGVAELGPGSAATGADQVFQARKLSEVAAELERQTHVRILVAPELAEEAVNADIKPGDLQRSIKSLLKGFDHMAIVDRQGNYRKIWISGRKSFATPGGGAGGDAVERVSGPGVESHGTADLDVDPPAQLPVAIWEPLEDYSEPSEGDGAIPSAPIQTDPAVFESMHVGQPLELVIPQEEMPLFAVVGETHSQLNGEIQVWSGPIDGAHETASFTITRGEITTYITVATGTAIYEISVDNVTGLGQVVNEEDLTRGKTDQDFVIPEEAGTSSHPG